MWFNDKWLTRLMAAEQLLTSLPPAGEDDLQLEPGLVSLASPRGLNEAILLADNEKDDLSEGSLDTDLPLDEHEEGGASE